LDCGELLERGGGDADKGMCARHAGGGGLAETSTMRGLPEESKWESFFI